MSAASRKFDRFDLGFAGLLAFLGAMQCAFCVPGADFYGGDTSYLELARSIIAHRPYGFDFRVETMLPPGFPAMLALLQLAFGESHVRLVRIMVIVTMISLLVAYFLLRRTLRKQTAAGICLLLASSAAFFQFASTFVFSDMPYFLTSMAALLVVDRLDRDRNRGRHRSLLLCLAALLICVSLLIRTSGLALVLGIVVWVAATLWFNRARGLFRLRTFGALVVCGLVVQVAWSAWAAHYRVDEWPTGGYPKPYLAQLTVKNGNEPELGFASLADIPARITQNVTDRAAALDYLLTAKTGNRLITARWFLPWIFGPVALVVLGLIRSIRRSGGTLAEWYFIVHEAIYLIWPWDFEMRFFLPVAPLACLYAWRGAQGCLTLLRRRRKWSGPVVRRRLEAFAFVLLCALLVNGLVHQIDVARKNRAFELSNTASYPDIVAAEWINAHVPPGAVIMARLWDVAYHYADRRVVWFPPSTDADLLIDGIIKHHVDFVVVVTRGTFTYWRPDDDRCFKSVVERYPDRFTLVQTGKHEKIYAVVYPETRPDTRHTG